MSVGKMRHRLTIQSPTRTTDGAGGVNVSWTEVATVWGSIDPQSGSEQFFGDQLEGRSAQIITIRFRRGLTNANRILYSFESKGTSYTRTFNVTRVENVGERNAYLKLYCTEGVAT